MDTQTLQRIIEGALLAAAAPMSLKRLTELFGEDEAPEKPQLDEALAAIAEACQGRGFELKEVASGWRFQVREELAPWINRLWEEKPQKYSRALLETLALIAYRQPITRGDIEEIRGVAVSSHIIKTLAERNWVKVVGHRDVPGRPSLYATTRDFLDYFNLKSLDELPSLSEIRDLDEINASLDLDVEMGIASASAGHNETYDNAGDDGEIDSSAAADAGQSDGSALLDVQEDELVVKMQSTLAPADAEQSVDTAAVDASDNATDDTETNTDLAQQQTDADESSDHESIRAPSRDH
ncbi:MAG TPA: SMC-Scp complex subunit ScpB [Cellvibrionaceae bacterium]